ncbi:MAG: hypothetical protein KGN34_15915 [Sphingomonadales bacterium]|nr:hypothetical protein [Sphingomonadales bacterium]
MRRLLLLFAIGLATPANAQGLATAAQLDHERAVIAILARPAMRAATARVLAAYRADPQAATPAGKATAPASARSIATAAANYALAEDASRPAVVWWVNAPHRWHGMAVPGSGFGIDNPDNVYQGFTVAGGGHYVVRGRLPSPGPVQLHMEVRDSIPGMGEMLVEGGKLLATIQSEQMHVAKDGSFAIAVDSDPAGTRPDHLAIPASGTFMVNVRQLLTDWARQRPIALSIERLDAVPAPPPRDITRLAQRGAEILDRIGPYWLDYGNRFLFARPVNAIAPPRVRPGGRGMSASGPYRLGDDEALLITADALGAASLGVQIADPWGVAYDYRARTSSLNQTQARADADGLFRFIVAARDPGYANWLDSGGFGSGMAVLRWQGLPAGADPARAIRSVSVVKLADLPQTLPAATPRFTAAQRAAQRRQRAHDYAARLRD